MELVALVYRSGKGCQQYPFQTVDQMRAWCQRHPYRNEVLRVMAFHNRRQLCDEWIEAPMAADLVNDLLKKAS